MSNQMPSTSQSLPVEPSPHSQAMQLADMLANLPIAAYVCDLSGRITYFNSAAATLWGRSPSLNDPDELYCGSRKIFLIDGQPISHAECPMAVACEKREDTKAEVILERADGEQKVVMVRVEGITNSTGQWIGAVNYIVDITEKDKALAELQTSEARYRGLLEVIPDMIFRLDASGVFIDCKPASEELIAPPEAFLGKHYAQILPPNIAEQYRTACELSVKNSTPQRFDYKLELSQGNWQAYEGRVIRGDSDFVVMVRNVTEDKQSREALIESERKYRDLVETHHCLICSTDAEGKFTFVNEIGAREILGYEPEEIIGNEITAFTVPARIENDLKQFECLLGGNPIFNHSTALIRKDGKIATLNLNAVPVYSSEGELTGVFCTAMDVTRRQRAENAFRSIVEGTVRASGEAFYRSLVRHLAEALGHPYVVLGELVSEGYSRIRTIAVWDGEKIAENFEYDLIGTLCEFVFRESVCCFQSNVQQQFPYDELLVEMEAESYLGTPIVDADGKAMGILAVIGTSPMTDESESQTILKIFADRAATELERSKAEVKLRKSEARLSATLDRLEVTTKGTSDGLWDHDILSDRVWVSGRLMEMLGEPPDDKITAFDFWDSYFHPEDFVKLKQSLDSHLQHGDKFDIECRLKHASGGYRWFRSRGRSTADDMGNPVRMSGSLTDISDRKATEIALRESEERYRTIFSSAPDSVLVIAAEGENAGVIVSANEFAARQHGYEIDELVGMKISELDVPQDAIHVPERLRRLKEGERLHFEVEHFRKNGSRFPVEVSAEIIYLNGKAHVLAFDRDITERRLAEKALRKSEERLNLAVDAAGLGPWDWDIPSGQVLFSREWKRQLGYEDNEIANRVEEWKNRLHPEDRDFVAKELEEYLEGRKAEYHIEFRLQHKDGKYRWINSRGEAQRDENGIPTRMLGCHIDVTKRKLTEDAVRESEQKLAAIAATLPFPLYVWDLKEQQTIFRNRSWAEDLGYAGGEIAAGMEILADLLHPDDLAKMPENFARWNNASDKDILETEYRLRNAAGEWRWFISRDTVYKRNSEGEVQQIIGIMQDVTKRKQADEERQKLEMQILRAQKLESLGVLAGGIAHDFNNLLTAMLGYSTLAQSRVSEGSPVLPMLKEIQKASEHAAGLTKQMLAFAGKGKVQIESIHLKDLVEEMSHLIQSLTSKKATVEFDLEPAVIEGDAAQIRQIIMNLVSNASDALEEKAGKIEVHIGTRFATAQELSSTITPDELPSGEYAFIRVTDNGCGMDTETQTKIFDPFFSTKFTGKGLGLAAVIGIVHSHRGTIRIHSTVGAGTLFELFIPATNCITTPVQKDEKKLREGVGTILVIEDEVEIGRLAENILTEHGFHALSACTGMAGIEVFNQHQKEIVAVLLDLTMPEMDGVEVLEVLRQLTAVPVILMSGYSEQHLADIVESSGANGFIHKPFTSEELAKKLLDVIDS
jgi:two-component system cell cycle sensor histidine kinase/response regulator CckA